MLDNAIVKRDSVLKNKTLFEKNLQNILAVRDITPDKMKNASMLKIELPRFSGYEGRMDLFTFKSEFQKLIEPTVQKKYLADYLKRNYLTGTALTLVEKEKDYNKIWARLLESYGDARLMLQNKLGDLDKIGGLWKIKGEEKIANALASLINAMKDLGFLAAAHNIEGQLYEGCGLEKVMLLVGTHQHQKFRTGNYKTESKKTDWENLLEFLNEELHLREQLVLDCKTAQLMGFDTSMSSDGGGDKPKKRTNANYGVSGACLICHFCDQAGHTVITTYKGRQMIPYYVCEEFVSSSAAERFLKLKSKHLCTQCMFPRAVKGPKHKCFYLNYCCLHMSHKGNEKPHVLLCSAHKNETANLNLLEKFKEKFIKNCKVELPPCSKAICCFSDMVGVAKIQNTVSTFDGFKSEPDIAEGAMFQLQTI